MRKSTLVVSGSGLGGIHWVVAANVDVADPLTWKRQSQTLDKIDPVDEEMNTNPLIAADSQLLAACLTTPLVSRLV